MLYQGIFIREDLSAQTRHLTRGPIHPPISTRAVATLKDSTTWSSYCNTKRRIFLSKRATFSKLLNLSLEHNYDADAVPSVNHKQNPNGSSAAQKDVPVTSWILQRFPATLDARSKISIVITIDILRQRLSLC